MVQMMAGRSQITKLGTHTQVRHYAGRRADRRSAKNTDRPMNKSSEAHPRARPLHSPRSAMRRFATIRCKGDSTGPSVRRPPPRFWEPGRCGRRLPPQECGTTARGAITIGRHDQARVSPPGIEGRHTWTPDDPLEPLEQALVEHASAGTCLDRVGDNRVDRQAMKEWGAPHTVRAAVLRHLLVESQWRVHGKGVQVRGVRITGQLDLESATMRCPVLLEDCYLDSPYPLTLDYATVSRIVLRHCRVVGDLTANLLVVTKELDLAGSAFEGVVRLLDAHVTGQLTCSGAQLDGTDGDGNALVGDQMRVGGLFLDQGLVAAGAIRLPGAEISGQLICRGAQFNGTDGDKNALVGDRMNVGDVLLDQGFVAAGAIRLADAEISGQLSCRGAQLNGTNRDGDALVGDRIIVGGVYLDQGFVAAGAIRLPGAAISVQLFCRGAQLNGTNRDGDALVGDRLKVGGGVFLDGGFTAAGAIRLANAEISGQLICHGAQLNGTDGDKNALVGDGLKVGGSVLLDEGFTAVGAVDLTGGRIGGSVSLDGAMLAEPVALRAGGIQVGGPLEWAPRSPVRGLVDLQRAMVHRLDDDWSLPDAHWPHAGRLLLDGFSYDGFGGQHQASWRHRLKWIRQSHVPAGATTEAVFVTQPYEQLARIYRQVGQDNEAQQVTIARRNDLRGYGSLTHLQKLSNWLLDRTIRHGYRPLRAVVLLVVLYVLVLLGALFAQHHDGVIVPAKDARTIRPAPTALNCSSAYPCFYPAGYAVDVVVPIINLGQAENWRPSSHAPWGWAYITVGWVATGLGWAFTTLAVAGYTGLIRKD
jgi:hypothetical protein